MEWQESYTENPFLLSHTYNSGKESKRNGIFPENNDRFPWSTIIQIVLNYMTQICLVYIPIRMVELSWLYVISTSLRQHYGKYMVNLCFNIP